MRASVKKVAEYFPTAIISGRSRDKVVEQFLEITNNFLSIFKFAHLSECNCACTYSCSKKASLSVAGSNFSITPVGLRYINL